MGPRAARSLAESEGFALLSPSQGPGVTSSAPEPAPPDDTQSDGEASKLRPAEVSSDVLPMMSEGAPPLPVPPNGGSVPQGDDGWVETAWTTIGPEQETPPNRFVFTSPWKGMDQWRTHWPAQSLMASGWDVEVLAVGSMTKDLPLLESDVVVIHTTNQQANLAGLVHYLKRNVHKVVLDFDDDYTRLADIQPTERMWFRVLYADIAAACLAADAITVATPVLAGAYRKWKEPIIARNYMPRRYAVWTPDRPHRVGWMGYTGAAPGKSPSGKDAISYPHRADMQEVADSGALAGLELWAVGDVDGVREVFSGSSPFSSPENVYLPENERRCTVVNGTGRLAPEFDLYEQMARCRVGIAPLAEHPFNASKSFIKGLEWAYCGVPAVLPAWHPAYQEFAHHGIPTQLYNTFTEMREQIDRVLSLCDDEWFALSDRIRADAMFMFDERSAGEAWRAAMWRVLG